MGVLPCQHSDSRCIRRNSDNSVCARIARQPHPGKEQYGARYHDNQPYREESGMVDGCNPAERYARGDNHKGRLHTGDELHFLTPSVRLAETRSLS